LFRSTVQNLRVEAIAEQALFAAIAEHASFAAIAEQAFRKAGFFRAGFRALIICIFDIFLWNVSAGV